MKKNCNGCRAINGSGINQHCDLGYKTRCDSKDLIYTHIYEMKPLEECPKPKTNSEYIFLRSLKLHR